MGYGIPKMTKTNNTDPLLVKKDQNVLSMGLNRPKVLNSLNHDMVRLIQRAIDEAKQDDSINLVLLYGEGNRGFCAGGDIRAMAQALGQIITLLEPLLYRDIPCKTEMDDWVKTYFAGKTSITGILEELRQCSLFSDLCRGVFSRLSERSPTALTVTLQLLRHNEGRPMEEVFMADLRAARFLLSHSDFLEGVRARLTDKDDRPRWRPESLDKVGAIDLEL